MAAIKDALRAIVGTIVSVITLPFRVVGRLLRGASRSGRKAGRAGKR